MAATRRTSNAIASIRPFREHPLFSMAPDASTFTKVRREVERGGYAVTRVRVNGDTVFHREHAVRPEPISGATRRGILEEYVSAETLQRAAPSSRALQGAVEEGLTLPAAHPAVTKVVVGSDGRTWLRGPDDRSGAVPWTVLVRGPLRAEARERWGQLRHGRERSSVVQGAAPEFSHSSSM